MNYISYLQYYYHHFSVASRSDLEGTMDYLSEVHSSQAVEWMTVNNVRYSYHIVRYSQFLNSLFNYKVAIFSKHYSPT